MDQDRYRRLTTLAHHASGEVGLLSADDARKHTTVARAQDALNRKKADRLYVLESMRAISSEIAKAVQRGEHAVDVQVGRRDAEANIALCAALRDIGFNAQALCPGRVGWEASSRTTTIRVSWLSHPGEAHAVGQR